MRPAGWWFVLVPIVILVGVGFAVRQGFTEAQGFRDRFGAADERGTGTIHLRRGSDASVWHVEQGVTNDSIELVPSTAVVHGPDGQLVEYRPARGRTTVSINDKVGIRIGSFTAPVAGDYRYDVDTARPVPILVGDFDIFAALRRVALRVLWGALAGAALLVSLILLRRRSRRAADAWNPAGPSVPGPPATPPAQGPISFN